jgi:hypothetical protein
MTQPAIPAGWYPDPDNTTGYRYGSAPSLRYFDGVVWTDDRAPMQRRPRQAPMPPMNIVNQVHAAPTIIVSGGTNHGLHLLLTVLTCGLWLPVWIIVAVTGR